MYLRAIRFENLNIANRQFTVAHLCPKFSTQIFFLSESIAVVRISDKYFTKNFVHDPESYFLIKKEKILLKHSNITSFVWNAKRFAYFRPLGVN